VGSMGEPLTDKRTLGQLWSPKSFAVLLTPCELLSHGTIGFEDLMRIYYGQNHETLC
jgi:hypothetical protein